MINKLQVNDNLVLFQDDKSLPFGTDAYLLYAFSKSAIKENACEFGSGSGIVSLLSMNKRKFKHMTMFEIQKDLYDLSTLNIKENGLENEIDAYNMNINDIPVSYNNSFGVIISNPPYIKLNTGFSRVEESDETCCKEVNGTIDDFCLVASRLLKNKGVFYCVYRPDRLSTLLNSLVKYKLEPKRLTFVYPYVDSKPSLILCESRKMGNEGLFITKPLIIYKDKKSNQSDDNYTEDMKYIYSQGDFSDEFRNP